MNPMDLRKGIKLAADHVVDVLSDISKPISTKEEVAQVGTISANRWAWRFQSSQNLFRFEDVSRLGR